MFPNKLEPPPPIAAGAAYNLVAGGANELGFWLNKPDWVAPDGKDELAKRPPGLFWDC